MTAIESLDKEITGYLHQLTQEQKEAVLSVVKTFAREKPWFNDDDYQADIGKRFEELENDTVQSISLSELEAEAKEIYAKKRIHK